MSELSVLESGAYTLADYEALWLEAELGKGGFNPLEVLALRSLNCAHQYAQPLYDACLNQYSHDRGYNFCGPFQRELAQVIKEDIGVPITQIGADEPHLQLHINRLGETDDQTSLVYYIGEGTAIILDGVIRLAKARAQPGLNALHTHWTRVDDLKREFADMGLTPLYDESSGQAIVSQDELYPHTVPFPYDEMERIMHTDDVYSDMVTLSNGQTIDVRSFWGPRLRAVHAEVRRRVRLSSNRAY
jgi:hypothetical protein